MKTYYILILLLFFPIYLIAQEEDKDFFVIVEQQPEPIGGMKAFYKHVSENLVYPEQARRMGVEGTVYLQFVVDKDGSLTDVKVIRGIGSGCDEEAVRVIKNAPKWKPGLQKGKPVKVRMSLPIIYKLGGDEYDEEGEKLMSSQYILLNDEEVTISELEDIIQNENELALMKIIRGKEAKEKYGEKANEGALIVYSDDFKGIDDVISKAGVSMKIKKKKGVYKIKFSYSISEKAQYAIGIAEGEGEEDVFEMVEDIYSGELEKGEKDFEWETNIDIKKNPHFIMIGKGDNNSLDFNVTVIRIK